MLVISANWSLQYSVTVSKDDNKETRDCIFAMIDDIGNNPHTDRH